MIENLKDEIWMVHPKYTNYYASNLGRIKHITKKGEEKLNKLTPNSDGYLQLYICKDGKKVKSPMVHRFVWECFHQELIPSDLKNFQINHINEDKTDNKIFNLSLVSSKANCDWGTRNERISKANINNPKRSKQVEQYDVSGNLVKIWKSTAECGRNGFNFGNISECCNNKRKTHRGFIWRFMNE